MPSCFVVRDARRKAQGEPEAGINDLTDFSVPKGSREAYEKKVVMIRRYSPVSAWFEGKTSISSCEEVLRRPFQMRSPWGCDCTSALRLAAVFQMKTDRPWFSTASAMTALMFS